jgi:hypothetical protein
MPIRGAESTRLRDRPVGEDFEKLLAAGEFFFKILCPAVVVVLF